MSSSRKLTKRLKEEIKYNILNLNYNDKIEKELKEKMYLLIIQSKYVNNLKLAYDKLYSLMGDSIDDYRIYYNNYCELRVDNLFLKFNLPFRYLNDKIHSYLYIRNSESFKEAIKGDVQLIEVLNLANVYINAKKKDEMNITKTLGQFTTVKQLITNIPEIEPFLPNDVINNRNSNLPVDQKTIDQFKNLLIGDRIINQQKNQ